MSWLCFARFRVPRDNPTGALRHGLGQGKLDVHAFVHHEFDGCEIQVLTERLAGFPPKSYSATRSWTDTELDGADGRLTARGLLEAGGPTAAGRGLVGLLQPWGDALRAGGGYYPTSPQQQVLHSSVDEWLITNGPHPLDASSNTDAPGAP